MQKSRHSFSIRRAFFLSAAALVVFTLAFAFSFAHATSVQTQSQPQATPANPSDFKFEVASIKPTQTPDGGWYLNGTNDGIKGQNVPLEYLIRQAFGIYEEYRYSGGPKWLSSDCYDLEAKMESSVADAFRKLPRAQRALAEQHMLQALLEERFNLKVHRETKEFTVYFLVVAKNGPKLQESRPNPDDPNAPKGAVWHESMKGGLITLPAQLVPIEQLASRLSRIVGREVLDKTGLAGTYDFTLRYAPDLVALPPSAGGSEGQPAALAADPNGVSIFTALQEQLGLKLEPGKGPVEIIVIDRVERASGN
jgi:uncharacterized protein (TIGR03435 family)